MTKNDCYHCGTESKVDKIEFDNKLFCCIGCKTVFEILNQHKLTSYYDLEEAPGSKPAELNGKYDYLDNREIAEKLVEFSDENIVVTNFMVPTIHCSSCIWILENLNKLHDGIKVGLVNFPKKEVRITFKSDQISLRETVELISSIGYEPYISLDDSDSDSSSSPSKIDKKTDLSSCCCWFCLWKCNATFFS